LYSANYYASFFLRRKLLPYTVGLFDQVFMLDAGVAAAAAAAAERL
jgi:hypothetical protein